MSSLLWLKPSPMHTNTVFYMKLSEVVRALLNRSGVKTDIKFDPSPIS